MKVLITGGAGFIGSHIADLLIAQEFQVVIVDNLSTGKVENINKSAVFYPMDIRSDSLQEVFEKEKPEFVIHHAAQIDVQTSIKQPKLDGEVNILGTVNVLENCIQHGVKKIIYPSSAAIYGRPVYLPIDENHNISPMSQYGISKYTPEQYIRVYSSLYDLKHTIFRYSNVYGPRQAHEGEGGVVAIFQHMMKAGQPPMIFGDGSQTRDYIYVGDVAQANLKVLTQGDNEIFNISTNEKTTVNRLFSVMKQQLHFQGEAQYGPERPGDIPHSILSNQKALMQLDWQPCYNLKTGLQEMLQAEK
ncbi:NAD-dependent epimerase/dehydratase family protein [Geosporobacter ferrireducens]|uniref:NAD-dependent epimerase/dehydratase family protein n=1 Tax=Geosporobacter ferrireducens TaxID=1424294 RepID=UPI00139D16D1|nr:NAD-dependent epimerase/dehydratase family protein [Geosporobacter ferrireducens]MTI53397.1 NAD-dependent epimerase/dehydratase family protein [Geosporobacter ferrireducens]